MTFRGSQSASSLYKVTTSPQTSLLRRRQPLYSTVYSSTASQHRAVNPIRKAQYSKLTDNLPADAMQAVKQTIAQNIGVGGSHELVPEHQQFDLKDTPDLTGKVAVVTGGSEGIGYGDVFTFLEHGIEKVFILSVSHEVIAGALKDIADKLGEDKAKKVTWYECDISDWRAVKKTADEIASETDRLDILINNAGRGIMTYQLTDYGVDRHVSTCSPSNNQANKSADGNEPYGPRHPNLPPDAPPQKDRRQRQHSPYLQHGLKRPPRRPLGHQIRLPRRAQPRPRRQRPIRPLKTSRHPLFPLPKQTPHLHTPQHPRKRHAPRLRRHEDEPRRYP